MNATTTTARPEYAGPCYAGHPLLPNRDDLAILCGWLIRLLAWWRVGAATTANRAALILSLPFEAGIPSAPPARRFPLPLIEAPAPFTFAPSADYVAPSSWIAPVAVDVAEEPTGASWDVGTIDPPSAPVPADPSDVSAIISDPVDLPDLDATPAAASVVSKPARTRKPAARTTKAPAPAPKARKAPAPRKRETVKAAANAPATKKRNRKGT